MTICASDDDDNNEDRPMPRFTMRSNHDGKERTLHEGTHQEFRQKLRDDERQEADAAKLAKEREAIIRQREAALDPRSEAVKKRDALKEHLGEMKKQGRKEGVRILQGQLDKVQQEVE